MQFRRCGGRQIVEEKLGRHRRLELVLIALSTSHHCYITAAACSFDSFYFILRFPKLQIFLERHEICFSKAMFKERFQLTSLLFCWEKTRLEIENLITIVLSWLTWIIPKGKQTSFKNVICQSYPGLRISVNDSAVLRDRKKNTTKMYIARASQK